jgi:hypothetical protein
MGDRSPMQKAIPMVHLHQHQIHRPKPRKGRSRIIQSSINKPRNHRLPRKRRRPLYSPFAARRLRRHKVISIGASPVADPATQSTPGSNLNNTPIHSQSNINTSDSIRDQYIATAFSTKIVSRRRDAKNWTENRAAPQHRQDQLSSSSKATIFHLPTAGLLI